MAKGLPSMAALLGMVAWAGFQNREKLMEMYKDATAPRPQGRAGETPIPVPASGDPITSGIKQIIEALTKSDQKQVADSWVGKGPNEPIDQHGLEQAVGRDVIDQIAQQTGLNRLEVLKRLTDDLPRAVDGLTPDGRVPT